MGYHIPSTIEETSEHAKKFMKYARLLEQVGPLQKGAHFHFLNDCFFQIANFHNTIGDRMIPSQKPMMLADALELSKLVQEQEVVSWGEEKHVQKYVDTLKKSVEKLSHSNSLLTSYHAEIIEKVVLYSSISLILTK